MTERTGKGWLVKLSVVAAIAVGAGPSAAWTRTIHRSFRSRDIGFGGGASVSVPVDARVDQALDEQRAQVAARERSIVGRVTCVRTGGLIEVTPNGGSMTKVRLRQMAAPAAGEPGYDEATAFLKGLAADKTVEVRYAARDAFGRVLGTVYRKEPAADGSGRKRVVDLNLTMILNGWARHERAGDAASASAYDKAERAARAAKRGIWAAQDR